MAEHYNVEWYEKSIKDYFYSNGWNISAEIIAKMFSIVNKHEDEMILDFKNSVVRNFDNVDIPFECDIFNDRHGNIIKARTALTNVAADNGIDLWKMAKLVDMEDERRRNGNGADYT